MSALYVRNLVRTWAGSINPPRFYDTINLEQNPKEDIWWTVRFFAQAHENKAYCRPEGYTERGEFDLIFCARPGIGDNPLLFVMEPALADFFEKVDANGFMVLETWTPVGEYSVGDADPWYRLGVGVSYTYAT